MLRILSNSEYLTQSWLKVNIPDRLTDGGTIFHSSVSTLNFFSTGDENFPEAIECILNDKSYKLRYEFFMVGIFERTLKY